MRVLLVSKFLHHVGGVETYLSWLADSLQAAGCEVGIFGMRPPPGESLMHFGDSPVYVSPHRAFDAGSARVRAGSAFNSIYSRSVGKAMISAISAFKPDVVHFHGTCYQLTPVVFRVTANAGAGRLMTAHEYKLACANQRLWKGGRGGTVCTKCVGASVSRKAFNPILEKCIKDSLIASALGGIEAIVSNQILRGSTDILIHSPSKFMEDMLLSDGWPHKRIYTLDLPWRKCGAAGMRGSDFLYMGRLSPEKDVVTLLKGWSIAALRLADRSLVIAGSGPDDDRLREYARTHNIPRVSFVGRVPSADIGGILSAAAATVHPANWYENSPFSVRESLMAGVPALVARMGGMPELVLDGVTGVHVEHSAEGWARAMCEFASDRRWLEVDIADAVLRHGIGERAHMEGLFALYERARRTADA